MPHNVLHGDTYGAAHYEALPGTFPNNSPADQVFEKVYILKSRGANPALRPKMSEKSPVHYLRIEE